MSTVSAIDLLVTSLQESPHPYVVVRDLYILGEDMQRLLSQLDHDARIQTGPGPTWIAKNSDERIWIFDSITGWDAIPTDDGERYCWEDVLTHSDYHS